MFFYSQEPSVITVEKQDTLLETAPTRPRSAEKEAVHAIIAKRKAIWPEIAPTVTPRGAVVETRGHATTVTDQDTSLGTARTDVEGAAAAVVDGNRPVTSRSLIPGHFWLVVGKILHLIKIPILLSNVNFWLVV